jgi:adenylosuccinate synthase
MPYHVALDHAREKARGGGHRHHRARHRAGLRGQGRAPAAAPGDLFHRERFAAKLGEVLDYHNFVLKNYFKAEPWTSSNCSTRCLA